MNVYSKNINYISFNRQHHSKALLVDDSIDFLRTEDDEKREENEQAAAEAAKDLDLDLGIAEEDGQEPKSTKT